MSIKPQFRNGTLADFPIAAPKEQHVHYGETGNGKAVCIISFTTDTAKLGYAISPEDARTLAGMLQSILYLIDNGIKAVQ